jgi:hypothetical protein
MRIPNENQAVKRYNTLKSTLETASQKPSNNALFSQQGDRFELTQDVRVPIDGRDVVITKGSAFDNDIKTKDTISTRIQTQEGTQADSYEHFSERRGLIFKRDQEMMKVTLSDQAMGSFSSNSATFEI